MKRYRDCTLICKANQKPEDLLQIVADVSVQKGYKIKKGSSLASNDTLYVYFNLAKFPSSRIAMGISSEKTGVSIFNIVPLPESGVSYIEAEVYNQILDKYSNDVFQVISENNHNQIKTNTEDYTLQELIPTSFPKLAYWLNEYPLSSHHLDKNRWSDFVISLHKNERNLSVEDLGNYIKDNYNWSDNDILKTQLRLESDLDLLDYYDSINK